MHHKQENLRYGQRATLISIVASSFLVVLKATVGVFSGALVLVTDALDSASDVVSNLASYFGLKISEKEPDARFNYGYYKAESMTSLFISALITYGAIIFLIEGYKKLFSISVITHHELTLVVAMLSALVALRVSIYLKEVGKKINSSSLIANSKDRLKDFFSSIVILISLVLSFFKIPYAEGIVIIGLSLLILRMGILSIRDSALILMDMSPKGMEEKVKRILNSVKGIEGFKDLRLRKAGPFVFGEADVKVKRLVNVTRAHDIAEQIEREIKEKIKEVASFTVHVEPFKPARQKLVVPIKKDKGLDSELMEDFGRANYLMFVTIKNNKILRHYVKRNPYKKRQMRAGLKTVHYILEESPNALVTKQIGAITFHNLRGNLVDIYETQGGTVKEVVHLFLKKELKRLKKPTKEKI